MDAALQLRLAQGKNGGPLQGGLDGFRSSAEHVANDLLHLAIRVLTAEQVFAPSFLFGRLDLEEVRVDDVTNVVRIKSRLVKVNNLLVEAANLVQILKTRAKHETLCSYSKE